MATQSDWAGATRRPTPVSPVPMLSLNRAPQLDASSPDTSTCISVPSISSSSSSSPIIQSTSISQSTSLPSITASSSSSSITASASSSSLQLPTPRDAAGNPIYSPRSFLNYEIESKGHDCDHVYPSVDDLYEIQELLGEGGWGKVYAGVRMRDGTKHALKIIKKQDVDWKSLAREVEILQSLDHPNILTFHELVLTHDECIIVTELLAGGELYSRLVSLEKFSEPDAHAVVSQLLSAMEYAHERGIMHRDLKPENIMMVDVTDHGRIKIIDWGLARLHLTGGDAAALASSSSSGGSESGKRGSVSFARRLSGEIGTPTYVAPEVLASRLYSEKCDMWSIGIIMFELLVGYQPFDAFDVNFVQTIEAAQLDFKPEDWDEISPSAVDLIKKLIVPDPDRRLSAKEARQHPWVKLGAASRTPLRSHRRGLLDRVRERDRRKSHIVMNRSESPDTPPAPVHRYRSGRSYIQAAHRSVGFRTAIE